MSGAGLAFGLVILLAALAWIGAPFLRREKHKAEDGGAERQRDRLLLIYERVLTTIRDLDEDYSTGKIGGADYQIERETWVQRGIQVLKALDRLDAQQIYTAPDDDDAIDRAIDDEIEQAVAAYRAKVN